MKNYKIMTYATEKPYEAIIYSMSFISPIEELEYIANDLKHININGKILFDLLICNGLSFNRYIEVLFNNGKFDKNSFSIIEETKNMKSRGKMFYLHYTESIMNSVLTDKEKEEILNISML
jgi:hypothetical protein